MRTIVQDVKPAFLSVLWIVLSQLQVISMNGQLFHQFKLGLMNVQVVKCARVCTKFTWDAIRMLKTDTFEEMYQFEVE